MMKNLDEVKVLYDTRLKPSLKPLERQREYTLILLSISIMLGVGAYYLPFLINTPVVARALSFMGWALVIHLTVYAYLKWSYYRQMYKLQVISKMLTLISPNFYYDSERHIDRRAFNNSKLSDTPAERCQGGDMVYGQIDKTDFQLSCLKAEYESQIRKNNGTANREWHPIFKGLFFHADFHKNRFAKTFIIPASPERWVEKYGQNLPKLSFGKKEQPVPLENSEFAKEFILYSSDPTEARHLLTPGLIEALLKIRKTQKLDVLLSFVDAEVYCAVEMNEPWFEPRLFRSGMDFREVERLHSLLSLIDTVIREIHIRTNMRTE